MDNIKFSRRTLLRLAAGGSAALLTSQLPGPWALTSAEAKSAPQFQNPLFGGDYPDSSIVRVGPDFYATHSCDVYGPQLLVWHSTDLVNWVPISFALTHSYGAVWAPDIIEHEGTFYIYFPMNGGVFVVHTQDPRTTWSEPIDLHMGGIDPGHVVGPDGTRYLFTAGANVIQLSSDGLSTVGQSSKVYDGWDFPSTWQTEGKWLESPKFTKRGQYYYMTSAEGGTSGPPTSHMAIVARSTTPLGPWENSPTNPLIHTYSADEDWWSVGHGTLVSTPDDRWYIVYHGYPKNFQSLGRFTLMEPIEWSEDGWPVAPLGAKRADPMPAPMGVAQRPPIDLSDDFKSPQLKVTWRAWDERDMSRFQPGGGKLIVTAKDSSPGHSSPLTIPPRDRSYMTQVAVQPGPQSAAAFGLLYDPNNWIFAELKGGQLSVYSNKQSLATQAWQTAFAYVRIVNRNNVVDFLASTDNRNWQPLVSGIDVSDYRTQKLGGFHSLRPALATSGTGTAQYADFVYKPIIS